MGVSAVSQASEEHRDSVWLMRGMKSIIFGVLFLAPIFYLFTTADVLFSKVFIVEVAAVLAVVLWLINVLVSHRVRYLKTPLNVAFLGLAVVSLIGTVMSANPWSSFWGPDTTGERAASLVAFVLLAFVTAAVFRKQDALRAAGALSGSFLVLGLFALVSMTGAHFGWQMPAWMNANPIGTVNALAVVLGAGFMFSASLSFSRSTSDGSVTLPAWVFGIATVASVVLFADLLLVGFLFLWVGIAAVTLFFLALNFARPRHRPDGRVTYILGSIPVAILFLVLLASAFFAFRPLPFAGSIFQPPVEIAPSLSSTVHIGLQELRVSPFTGSGPANFADAFNRFRDRALNDTVAWSVRFNHGFSYAATIIATGGVLGVLAFLAFLLIAAATILRVFWRRAGNNSAVLYAAGLGALSVFLMWFFYAGNFTASFLGFMFLGVFLAVAAPADDMAEDVSAPAAAEGAIASRLRIAERAIAVGMPPLNFLASLAVVFVVVFSAVALYGLAAQYVAETYFLKASQVFSQYGNTNTAKVFLDRASGLNPTEDIYYQGKAQVALAAVQRLIAQAAANPSQDLSAQFRTEFSDGITAGQKAVVLAPTDPVGWSTLGQIYETVVPFITGSDQAALDAYKKSAAVDPVNPTWPFAMGRTNLTQIDLLTTRISQTANGGDRSKLEAERASLLQDASTALQHAVDLKPDYAQAHFLLAQVALRENNQAQAIKKTEDTARIAPNDVGVMFQLGVLYYGAGRLDDAKAAFEQALLLNGNYSNARYFLGLIWDKKGDKDGALSQFQKIAALNPDNAEVKKIIANLKAGRAALAGIVPPETAPEARKSAPLQEGGSSNPLEQRSLQGR